MKNTDSSKNTKDDREKNNTSGCGDIVNDFIEDVWSVMTPQMVDRLKCILREDMGLSKQDVDKFIDSQREVRRQRICLKKNQRVVKIGPRNQWIKEVSKYIADQMAALVVGLLLSSRTSRTKRITEKVLERLCEIAGEDTTIESAKSRVERTLVVVADRMATWIDEAITEMEKQMQDKYMSAASLEALSVVTDELCPTTTTSSSESLTAKSSFSDTSKLDSKTTLSVATIDSEIKEVNRKSKEKSIEDELDKESKVSKAEKSSLDGATESPAEESEEEEEEADDEEEVETEEEGDEETVDDGDDETVLEEEEEESENMDEEIEPEEVEEAEEEEDDIEDENDEDNEEETEDEEPEIEDAEGEDDILEGLEVLELGTDTDSDRDVETIEKQKSASMVMSLDEQATFQGDILDLLKEDIANLTREERSDRQAAMKEIIDKRLEKIAKDKLNQSLDSIMKYDIDEAASIVANWVEKILESADQVPNVPSEHKSLGPAFEVKRGAGSQIEVSKISSTTVAKKVAEVRGLDPPLRKKKLPRTMSPMDLHSGKDWADWALGAADVGEKWGNWLDDTMKDAEQLLLTDRAKNSHRENYNEWAEWRDKRAKEALKWRVEQQKIKDEGKLWNRKMKPIQNQRPELVTGLHNY